LPKILVLEDETAIQTLVTAMLKIRGFECDRAGTVQEAHGLMARCAYDLVIADVHLPDGSGLSIAKDPAATPFLSS
jgi:DNA-binding response OmpR family regulator